MAGMQNNRKKKGATGAIKGSRAPNPTDIRSTNVALRRSRRRTSNVYASSKITCDRITLPFTFLENGLKSRTVGNKRGKPSVVTERNKNVLKGDLLALLREAKGAPREEYEFGTRTPSKIALSSTANFSSVSSYYLSCVRTEPASSVTKKTEIVVTKDDELGNFGDVEESREETAEDCTKFVNTTKTSLPNNSFLNHSVAERNRPINYKFCGNIFKQVILKFRSSKRDCLFKLGETIRKLDDILDGKIEPDASPIETKMTAKRLSEDEYDNIIVPLVPQSQWVYSTPDKQNMKKFVFDEGSDKILPAVIRTSKNSKVLYDIKNEVAQQLNLNKFKGQNVPIDRRYLRTICENAIEDEAVGKPAKKQRVSSEDDKENAFAFAVPARKPNDFVFEPKPVEFNVFLSGDGEESIDLHREIERTESPMEVSFEGESLTETIKKDLRNMEEKCHHFDFRQCRSALPKELHNVERDPYETAPVDYRHQLLMATQRPAKSTRRIQKRHLLKAKSLSFENTPPGAKVAVFEPKRIDMIRTVEDECIEQFEKEFCALNGAKDLPHTVTSGALNETSVDGGEFENRFDLKNFNEHCQTVFKFYPRRNYDAE